MVFFKQEKLVLPVLSLVPFFFSLLTSAQKGWGGVFQRQRSRQSDPVETMKDRSARPYLTRLTLRTNCVIVVHSPLKTSKVERVE